MNQRQHMLTKNISIYFADLYLYVHCILYVYVNTTTLLWTIINNYNTVIECTHHNCIYYITPRFRRHLVYYYVTICGEDISNMSSRIVYTLLCVYVCVCVRNITRVYGCVSRGFKSDRCRVYYTPTNIHTRARAAHYRTQNTPTNARIRTRRRDKNTPTNIHTRVARYHI